jgi:hypothetical protein
VIALSLIAGALASAVEDGAALLSDQAILLDAGASYRAGLEARTDIDRAHAYFARAARLYAELWDRGIHNAHLARNLAQSYLLAGDLGRSIAACRAGLHLVPHDRGLQEGLNYARGRVVYSLESDVGRLARPRESWSFLAWAPRWVYDVAVVVLWLAGCLALAHAWMKRRPFWWIFGGVVLIAAPVLHFLVLSERRAMDEQRSAVIVLDDTPFRTGNSTEYPSRLDAPLPAGVELRVLNDRGGWLQTQLAGGPLGWVPQSHIVSVE